MKTAQEIREALAALRNQQKELTEKLIEVLPVGSLKANGKHRKALLAAIASQESLRSAGLNVDFRLPTVDDGWTEKQIDSLSLSLENAIAKRTKLLTAKKDEIAADIAKKETVIEKWVLAKPRNDGKV